MPYFDPDNHRGLLPARLHEHPTLDDLAATVEADVIDMFVGPPPHFADEVSETIEAVRLDDDRYVYLRGYAVDPDEAAPALAERLRRTIADVIAWRVRTQEQRNPIETSAASAKGRSTSVVSWAHEPFPRSWDHRLRAFDVRPVGFAI